MQSEPSKVVRITAWLNCRETVAASVVAQSKFTSQSDVPARLHLRGCVEKANADLRPSVPKAELVEDRSHFWLADGQENRARSSSLAHLRMLSNMP